jgi:signal peptidase II
MSHVRPAAVAAIVVVLVDQVTKTLARLNLDLCDGPPGTPCDRLGLVGPLGLQRTENPDSALGLFGEPVVGPLLVLAVIIVVIQMRVVNGSRLLAGALGLELGGLVANLADRVAHGAVTDFIHIATEGDRGLVLNPADVGLLVGATLLTHATLVRRGRAKANGQAALCPSELVTNVRCLGLSARA